MCNIVGIMVILGALNWGLVGLFQYNLVASLLGEMSAASRAVYAVIGIAGVLKILSCFKLCPCQRGSCETKS
jgi:uncharacterized membrane protein YuzA (DUF378 family)